MFHSVNLRTDEADQSVKVFPVLMIDGQAGCMRAKRDNILQVKGKGQKSAPGLLSILTHHQSPSPTEPNMNSKPCPKLASPHSHEAQLSHVSQNSTQSRPKVVSIKDLQPFFPSFP